MEVIKWLMYHLDVSVTIDSHRWFDPGQIMIEMRHDNYWIRRIVFSTDLLMLDRADEALIIILDDMYENLMKHAIINPGGQDYGKKEKEA